MPDIKSVRKYAMWEDATLEQLQSKEELLKHLEKLKIEFNKDMNKLKKIIGEIKKNGRR
jgi:hypothetical protein